MSTDLAVVRIKPYHYVHVLDNNTNVTRVEVGPKTFTRQEHEKLVSGPDPMIMVPARHYCVIANPVARNPDGKVLFDNIGQAKLRHGDEEIRGESEPFPLYAGEKLVGKVTPLTIVQPNTALRLKCTRDFVDGEVVRRAGDEWLFEGPATYTPRVEVTVAETVKAFIIKPNQALKLRARKDTIDSSKGQRKTGEEWLVKTVGAYLPGVDEEVIETISAYVLTDKKALHLRAVKNFTDVFKKERKAGEEWLVTVKEADTHLPDVYEQVVGEVKITSLNNRQYCVVMDPVLNGKPQLGSRDLRKGETSFFLQPGEKLENGIQNVIVLGEEESLLLKARENLHLPNEKPITAGSRWMLPGPCEYVPAIQVEVLEKRRAIPLDENEGIYVRDITEGKVRAIKGPNSYMLKPNEELWKKELPKVVEDLLAKERVDMNAGERDKTRAVTFRAPHNSAVQVYDYKAKESRVIFGPELVILGPDEQFTIISLSGDKPKRPHVIKSLALLLGPDFMTDIVTVETADHARLSIKLSYNWHFKVDKADKKQAAALFQVPDFVGDSCKAIASRVRGAVAQVSFDQFHKNSAKIIRSAVFGTDEHGKIRDSFVFNANNLRITNIDIQSVEPVDQKTRDSLQKSVQLAIEITTKSQEAEARHESARLEQEALGRLERQKINDQAAAERARKELISLQAESAAVESTGQAKAEAKARAEAQQIEGEANVKQALLSAQAAQIKFGAEMEQMVASQIAEIEHQKAVNEMVIEKEKQLASIEAKKFHDVVEAIGAETIQAMAEAGPAMQAKLLQSLGLQSFLITDGHSPINLFNTAQGLIAPPMDKQNVN